MGIKDFILKQTIKQKMKGVPQAQQDMMMKLVEDNPDFFKKLGDEIKQKQKEGKGETAATMEVMRKHQADLQRLLMKSK